MFPVEHQTNDEWQSIYGYTNVTTNHLDTPTSLASFNPQPRSSVQWRKDTNTEECESMSFLYNRIRVLSTRRMVHMLGPSWTENQKGKSHRLIVLGIPTFCSLHIWVDGFLGWIFCRLPWLDCGKQNKKSNMSLLTVLRLPPWNVSLYEKLRLDSHSTNGLFLAS